MHPFIVQAEGGGKTRIDPCFKIESMDGSHVLGGSEQRSDMDILRCKVRADQHALEQSLAQLAAQLVQPRG